MNPPDQKLPYPAVCGGGWFGGLPPPFRTVVRCPSEGVPAAWLVLCGFGVVAGFAEAATACGVVAVESCFIEVAFAVGVVVSDGAEC